ncbi:MAG: TetR/AcrR family transcriptional regulator [Deltaproteobacteria bacterium]|nr:TetR/AcrR family transcriptional regulator [Deltaproteobacteria bacterium]
MPPSNKTSLGRPKDLEKREAIFKAAKSFFLKHGFHKASMDEIAANAGVSKLTVYGHYECKEKLFQEVIARKLNEYSGLDDFKKLYDLPLKKSLTLIGQNFLNLIFNPESLNIHRVVMSEASRHPKMAALFFETGPQRLKKSFVEFLLYQKNKKCLFFNCTWTACDHFFSMFKGELHMRALLGLKPSPSKKELQNHLKQTIEMYLRAYQPQVAIPHKELMR